MHRLLTLSTILVCSLVVCASTLVLRTALSQDVPPSPDESTSPQPDNTKVIDEKSPENSAEKSKKKTAFDASLVARGQTAFQASCTACHDGNLATNKQKPLNGWRNTVRRMASKDGAHVPTSDWEAIASYLTSLHQSADAKEEDSTSDADGTDERFSLHGTFSPLLRSSDGDIQNRGFFPDTWLGATFQSNKFVSGRATACLTCHNNNNGDYLDRSLSLVEAAVRFDLMQLVEPSCRGNFKASVDAGRFIVPFGAFSSQVNPGVFRTVSRAFQRYS